MRSALGVVIGVVLAALVVATPAGAQEPRGLDALPPLSASTNPIDYVGDAGTLRLGVSIVSETQAVAYLCDGEKVGVWFTGSVDLDTGKGSLKSKDGSTVTLDLDAEPPTATAVVDGETTTFDLAPVTGTGVLRTLSKAKGHRFTTGWIIANDGTVVGLTTDESGKPVAGVNTTGTPTPQSATTPSNPTDPVTNGAFRCALLRARIDRQLGTSGDASKLAGRASEAGCTIVLAQGGGGSAS